MNSGEEGFFRLADLNKNCLEVVWVQIESCSKAPLSYEA